MTRYELLINVLDRLRAEAPATFKTFHPDPKNIEAIGHARSLAYVHLLLKVYFGLLTFAERDEWITEGTEDGGVDAYFIDLDRRILYFVQSKFRQTEANFEERHVSAEDLLMMDIDRMIQGHREDAKAKRYNGRVQKMIDAIKGIEDIGRYQYKVVILANAKGVTLEKLRVLTGGLPTELIDHEEAYGRLLFPLLTGTYYTAESLKLAINLANKSNEGISYDVKTEFATCNITAVFVPALEVAKAMYRYRNSVLKFNPRSYLGHEGRQVNSAIRASIESRATNEFALFNNGITVLSDETFLNRKFGFKDSAQLVLTNPQIINGGQTAYTLSVIYRERLAEQNFEAFEGKEVLLKIITFLAPKSAGDTKKIELIEAISRATNQQTVVSNADRRANEEPFQALQRRLFEATGMLLERKRGEFEDGIREGYLQRDEVIDRTLFFRAALATTGRSVSSSKKRVAARIDYRPFAEMSSDDLRDATFGVHFLRLAVSAEVQRTLRISSRLLRLTYIATKCCSRLAPTPRDRERAAVSAATILPAAWRDFVVKVRENARNSGDAPRFGRDASAALMTSEGARLFARVMSEHARDGGIELRVDVSDSNLNGIVNAPDGNPLLGVVKQLTKIGKRITRIESQMSSTANDSERVELEYQLKKLLEKRLRLQMAQERLDLVP